METVTSGAKGLFQEMPSIPTWTLECATKRLHHCLDLNHIGIQSETPVPQNIKFRSFHDRRLIVATKSPNPVLRLSTDRAACLDRMEACSANVGLSNPRLRRRLRPKTKPGQAEEATGFRGLLILPDA